MHRQVFEAQERSLGANHPDTQATWRTLMALTNAPTVFTNATLAYARADQLFREGKFAEAEPYFRKLFQNQLRKSAETNEVLLGLSAGLARMLSEWAWTERSATNMAAAAATNSLSRAREAEQILRAAVAYRERVETKPKWRLPDTRSRLGFAIVALAVNEPALAPPVRSARFTEAEKLLLESFAALDADTTGVTATYRRDTVSYLVRLYEAWPNAAEAAHWKARLDSATRASKAP